MECPVKLLADGRRDDAALFNLRQPAIMLPDTGRYRRAAKAALCYWPQIT